MVAAVSSLWFDRGKFCEKVKRSVNVLRNSGSKACMNRNIYLIFSKVNP